MILKISKISRELFYAVHYESVRTNFRMSLKVQLGSCFSFSAKSCITFIQLYQKNLQRSKLRIPDVVELITLELRFKNPSRLALRVLYESIKAYSTIFEIKVKLVGSSLRKVSPESNRDDKDSMVSGLMSYNR